MVGARGFEPPTPCSQSRCATRLRYAPPTCRLDAFDLPHAGPCPTSARQPTVYPPFEDALNMDDSTVVDDGL